MENKTRPTGEEEWEKKFHYLLIGYANAKTHEDGKRQWKEIRDYFREQLSLAREGGRQEGRGEILDNIWKYLRPLHLECSDYTYMLKEIIDTIKSGKVVGDGDTLETPSKKYISLAFYGENNYKVIRRWIETIKKLDSLTNPSKLTTK